MPAPKFFVDLRESVNSGIMQKGGGTVSRNKMGKK